MSCRWQPPYTIKNSKPVFRDEDILITGNQWFFSSLLLQLRQRWLVLHERNFLLQATTYELPAHCVYDAGASVAPHLAEPFQSVFDLGIDNLRRSLAHLRGEILKELDDAARPGRASVLRKHFLLYLGGFYSTDPTAVTGILACALHPESLALLFRKLNLAIFCSNLSRDKNAIRMVAMVGELCDILDAITTTLDGGSDFKKELNKGERFILRSTAFLISETLAETLEMLIQCAKEVTLASLAPSEISDAGLRLARSLYAGTLSVETQIVSLLRQGKFQIIKEAIQILTEHAGNFPPAEKERLRRLLTTVTNPDYFCRMQVCDMHRTEKQALLGYRESQAHLRQIFQPLVLHLDNEIKEDKEVESGFGDEHSWAAFIRRLRRIERAPELEDTVDEAFWTLTAFDVHTCRLTDTIALVREAGAKKTRADQ
eukprot:Protomagalhaensia_sp_Gyna_25__3434@NODE_30_length_7280_cov_84_840492_g20_i0_p1_GENE_NODE_30_length_7280_cov_84_840492_g20_i0NODE_30_length_7280_cov_84_840492_g20_i0_p1_ORF_typecomplete_len429_score59_41PAT1/PF09770_9/0_017_NODE_30_length_7280_cov_84_840492_g20_i044235709